MNLEPIIGLEIHVQLKTKSKMFCSCAADLDTAEPNSIVCPICLGHPGTLPVINNQAVRLAHRVCLALNCRIEQFSKFDRKNYFYPDLPKGYQISQYDLPLGKNGELFLLIKEIEKKIGIERVHLEEDTGKLLHPENKDYSLIDFNRAGVPLLEIVTKPEIQSPFEAKKFLQELQIIMRYLKISDADMEKGQLRCDANISLIDTNALRATNNTNNQEVYKISGKSITFKDLNPKTEIKNLNSFRALERALEYEIKRQKELWEKGTALNKQSTRGWDENKGITIEQRVKEEVSEYRYFPEPDLPPLNFSQEYLEKMKLEEIPELPFDKRIRFKSEYGFSPDDLEILIQNKDLSEYTEKVVSELKAWLKTLEEVEGSEEEIWRKCKGKIIKLVGAWIINRLKVLLDEKGIEIKDCLVGPENLAEFITIIYQNKINSTTAQMVLEEMVKRGGDPSQIIEDRNLSQISTEEDLESIVNKVIKNNPQQVKEYKKGKINVIQFLVGQVMRETKGKSNPETVRELLEKEL